MKKFLKITVVMIIAVLAFSFAFTACYDLQTIGEYAFSSCSAVNEIFVPESVVRIGESAFNYFTGTLYVQIGQDEIPAGWHPKWKTTYGNSINVVWNAQA